MPLQVTIEDHFIPYLVIVYNVLACHLLRQGVTALAPESIRLILQEILATIELCACCAELGVVWELHGNIGLAVALFALCVWWCLGAWGDAEACPCGPIEEWFILGRQWTSPDIVQKLIGQFIGGYLTARWIDWIWCWHLTEQHHHLHTSQCEASLYVGPWHGAAIEGLITFISRLVALESERWSMPMIAVIANAATSVALVLFALNTTGGFFNPILASALMFGCQGHTHLEHFQVYWAGALIGSLAARYLHHHLLSTDKQQTKID